MKILKKISAVILICSLAQNVSAQDRKVKMGLYFDPNFNTFKSSDGNLLPKESKSGYNYGLNIDFYFAKNYAFRTGIMLASYKGMYENRDKDKYANDPQYVAPITTVNMQYLQIPTALHLTSFIDEYNRIGVYADFGLTSEIRIKSEEGLNYFRSGLLVGGGAEYYLSPSFALVGGLYYNKGFNEVKSGLTNNYYAIRLGLQF